ncbi:tripeptidyl aminopeptidase [Lentzea sp. NBRC 105346]|uniref:alpha/beta hydrolase n=1 Tax=Lentzea sp. NBRC 105346 TaxID=3032205 RepID=UPI0025557C43|nr:alpha/beta hydrolase [Lentzea sp. NBRC 105346]GLZ33873.1 tripeptidyl aminopeptidase [Lentzea sp. NBRC 105346]
MRRISAIGIGVVALMLVSTTASADPPDPLAEFYQQKVEWKQCSGKLSALECATLVAPLDYAKPAGDRISLVISRSKARAADRRRGVLFTNPGGPGGSGLSMPVFLEKAAVGDVYDLIGFDPRGVGGSTALNCRESPVIATPDSRPADADFPKWAAEAREAEEACARSAGGIRQFISTANTARDMDVVRGALGEPKINYLGYSYGTYLGAVYGTLFPARLDRSVLDSSVHPEWVWRDQFKAQAVAYRRDVEAWAAWVSERNGAFSLGKTPAEVLTEVEKVASALLTKPIGDHNRSSFDGAVGVGARYRPLWSDLATIVGKLRAGEKPAVEGAKAASLLARTGISDLRSGVFDTVTCESDWPTDVETYYEDMRTFRDRYPFGFGIVRAAPMTCTFRSFVPPEPPVRVLRNGYPVGVIVQSEGDTQTQYASGPAMASRLGNNLITVVDEGKHGLYGGGNKCVDERVDRYLIDGVLPGSTSECPGDARPDVPKDGEAPQPTVQADLSQSIQAYLDGRGLSRHLAGG